MRKPIALAALAAFLSGCQAPQPEPEASDGAIDRRSYSLGGVGAFAEMVGVGVKKLALSSPLSPEEMDALIDEARAIAERNGAQIHREEGFLVTDLFPAEITEGKHVLLIYRGGVKDEYLALKAEKEALVQNGGYEGEARKDIARKMGRLLSYPEEKIEEMLSATPRSE